jgi:undecaprenyl-diphosphatase
MGGKKGRVAAFLIIPVITLSDQISASVLKPLFGRIRPCHDLDFVRLLVNCGGKLAFPSSHATNISGAAMVFSLIYHKGARYFWFIALIVGYSRVYVGVHYPGDVLFGFFLGSLISLFIYILYLVIASKYSGINYLKS